MKKGTIIAILIGVLAIGNLFCMVFGPITWISSASHFAQLEEYKKSGVKSVGTIVGKEEPKPGSHYGNHYLDISYINKNAELVTAERVYIKRIIFYKVDYLDKVEIYYKPGKQNEVILMKSFEIQNLGFIRHPSYGKWMTIISYSFLLLFIAFIIYIKRKNKPKPYVRPKDF
jgi:hypothetical protein